MATEAKAKHKETYLGKQKNVGVNLMGIAALNKESNLEKAWNHCVKRKKVNRIRRKPEHKTIPSRWRRPGTTALNERKSIGCKGNRDAKQ